MVTGTDANQDALESIEKGELTATVDSDPFSQTFVPVEAAIKYVMNGEVPPKEMIVGEGTPTVIDKNNIAEFKANLAKRLEKYGIEPK